MTTDKESPEQMLARAREWYAGQIKHNTKPTGIIHDMLRLINHLAAREKELEGALQEFVDEVGYQGWSNPRSGDHDTWKKANDALASRGWRGEVG